MKKLLLLLIFVIVALDVLSQTNSVCYRDVDVVIPSERNKKHLNFLKDKYDVPSVSNMYDCSSMHGKSFDNMFVGFNYAYMSDPQHSFGITIGQVNRFGWFVSAMTGLGNEVTPKVWTKNFWGFIMRKKHEREALLKYMAML